MTKFQRRVPWSQLDVWHRPKVGRAAEMLQLVLCFRSLLAKTFNADMNVKYGCGLKSEVNLVWSIRRKNVWNNEQTYKCCSHRTQSHWRVNWFSATCKAALLSQFESHQNGFMTVPHDGATEQSPSNHRFRPSLAGKNTTFCSVS